MKPSQNKNIHILVVVIKEAYSMFASVCMCVLFVCITCVLALDPSSEQVRLTQTDVIESSAKTFN